jgi:hypothetical protein
MEYTATENSIVSWSDAQVVVALWNFFEDGIDPCADDWWGTGLEGRNFVQDDGAAVPCACPEEQTIKRCECASQGDIYVYIKAVYFGDEDSSGDLSCGDTIFEVEKSNPVTFNYTGTPFINKVNPRRVEVRVCDIEYGGTDTYVKKWRKVKLYGADFGETQGQVYVGTLGQYNTWTDAVPGNEKGKLQTKINKWYNTLIKFKFKYSCKKEGKKRYIWIVDSAGNVSNARPVKIIAPLQGSCTSPPVSPCP